MVVRAKTKRRVVLLIVIAVFVVGGGTGAFVIRKLQIRHQYAALRAQGLAAFEKARSNPAASPDDYLPAASALSRYISRYPADADAAFALAQSYRAIDRYDAASLQRQVTNLRRVLDVDPGRDEARLMLVEAYVGLNYNTEASDNAARLLKSIKDTDPRYRSVLLYWVKARLGLRKVDGNLVQDADRCAAAEPADVEAQMARLAVYEQFYKDAEKNQKIIQAAEDLYNKCKVGKEPGKYPDDGRFELILGMAYRMAGDWTAQQQATAKSIVQKLDPKVSLDKLDRALAAKVLFRNAAQRVPPDAYTVQVLVNVLDRAGVPGDVLALLQRSQGKIAAPWLKKLLVRRLWEAGKNEDVARILETLNPAAESSDTELLAIRALSLVSLNRRDQATPIIDALAARKDPVSVGWTSILRVLVLGSDSNVLHCAEDITNALAVQRGNPYLKFFLADADARLMEYEQAAELLYETQAVAASWPLPLRRLSGVLMRMNLGQAAMSAERASNARARAQQGEAAEPAVAPATQSGDRVAQLLQQIAEMEKSAPPGDENVLVAKLSVLIRAERRPEALKLLREALDRRAAATQPVAPADRDFQAAAILRLASLARVAAAGTDAKPSLEEQFLQLAENACGRSPDLAVARAAYIIRQAKPADRAVAMSAARELIAAWKKENQDPKQDLDWKLAEASFLDGVSAGNDALDAWEKLADDPAAAGSLKVQRAALAAPALQRGRRKLDDPAVVRGRALVDRCIDRLKALTGKDSVVCRKARARWYLETLNKQDTAQAVALLQDLVRDVATDPETRQLLAQAMVQSGNLAGAVEQLTVAEQMNPTSTSIALGLAELYQAKGDSARARALIVPLAGSGLLEAQQRRRAALLLTELGETEKALTLMQDDREAAAGEQIDLKDGLMRVELLRRENRPTEAGDLLKTLLAARKYDPKGTDLRDTALQMAQVIQVAADFYASRRDVAQAQATLARLDEWRPALPPGVAELLCAQYYAQQAQTDKAQAPKALEQYQAAVKADPKNAGFARALVSYHLRSAAAAEKPEERTAAINAALAAAQEGAKNTADKSLAALANCAGPVRAAAGDLASLPLALAVIESAADSDTAAEALRIIDGSRNAPADLLQKLRPLADRSPSLLALQQYVIAQCLAQGRRDDARQLALRCVATSPRSPIAARLAAETLVSLGDVAGALPLARQWHALLSGQDPDRSDALRHAADESCLPADLMVAQLQLRLNNPDEVLNQIKAFDQAAQKQPESAAYRALLSLRASALVLKRQPAQAADLLWPLLAKYPDLRAAWINIAPGAGPDASSIAAWLDRVAPLLSDVGEQVTLAEAFQQAGERLKDAQLTARSRTILDALVAKPEVPGFVLVTRAQMFEADGDAAAAERLYRRALQKPGDLPVMPLAVARNNLAMILARKDGGDLKEALDLATQAVAAMTNASLQDTLAFVQLKRKDYKAAAASYRAAVGLDPGRFSWRMGLVDALEKSGDKPEALRALKDLEALLPTLKDAPPAAAQQIAAAKARLAVAAPPR